MKKKSIIIEGMHCASCVSNVERSLSRVVGVKSVRASLMTRKALVECEEAVKDEELKKAVTRAGYKASF